MKASDMLVHIEAEKNAEIERLQAHKRAQAEDIMTLGQEIGRLQAALQRYGDHTYDCEQKEPNGLCTCGYSAALGL